jgi:uncharacterized membrane protein
MSLLVVSLLLLTAVAPIGMMNVSADKMGWLKVSANNYPMSNRYILNGNSVYLGSEGVTFSIEVYNAKWTWATYDSYQIRWVNATISSQRDPNGNPANIFDFSKGKNVVAYQYSIYQYSETLSGFKGDVAPVGMTGTYNLTVEFTYQYSTVDALFNKNWINAQDTDYVQVRVDAGVTVTKDVSVLDESDHVLSHYLYAGAVFQKAGVHLEATVDNIKEVNAVITMGSPGTNYLSISNTGSYIQSLNNYNWIYFKYRVDVKEGTPAGRYKATLEVKYQRNMVSTNTMKSIDAQSISIEFIVDFTPLLRISSPDSISISQGSLSTNLTGITFENFGNSALKNIDVWIDISKYFEENNFYFDGNGGQKILLPSKTSSDDIPLLGTLSVNFYNINVFKYLPSGEHRLPVGYSGYYYDTGIAGGSTDYKKTNESLYYQIKEQELYLKVNVVDPTHNFKVESRSSINLNTKMKDITLDFSVTNLEAVSVLYTTIWVGTKDKVTNGRLLIDPTNALSDNLEPIDVTMLPAQTTMDFTVNADVATGAVAGAYNLPVTITGVNANTYASVRSVMSMSVRVNPAPPRLLVTAVQYPTKIKAGGTFPLLVDVRNEGADYARNVFVTVQGVSAGTGVNVNGQYAQDVAKADSVLNPFTFAISKIYIGDLAPGEAKNASYTVRADKNIVAGKGYNLQVSISYTDDLSRGWSYDSMASIYAGGTAPEKATDLSSAINVFLGGLGLIIIAFICAVIFVKAVMRPRKPKKGETVAQNPPGTVGITPQAPQTYQEAPGTQAYAYPTAQASAVEAGPSKTCPSCYKPFPANYPTCPYCGTQV